MTEQRVENVADVLKKHGSRDNLGGFVSTTESESNSLS